jgi:hypothetical protein
MCPPNTEILNMLPELYHSLQRKECLQKVYEKHPHLKVVHLIFDFQNDASVLLAPQIVVKRVTGFQNRLLGIIFIPSNTSFSQSGTQTYYSFIERILIELGEYHLPTANVHADIREVLKFPKEEEFAHIFLIFKE